MQQLLETKHKGYCPEWTEAMYGYENPLTVTEAKLDSIIKEVELLHLSQYYVYVCVYGMALLGVLAVTISWLSSFFMDRRLLRGRQHQQQLGEEMMTTMRNDDETASYQRNDNEVFPKWVGQQGNKLLARIKFDKKRRHVGLFHSRQAARIALNYAEEKLQGLKKRKLSKKETDQEMKNIAKEARDYARQRVPVPTVRRELPIGVVRHGKKYQANVWFNIKQNQQIKHIGDFNSVEAATISRNYAQEKLNRVLERGLSEKQITEMMKAVVKDAKDMGHRFDGELNNTSTPPHDVVGTNTARQPRIATRKRSPAATTWEENSTRTSKRQKTLPIGVTRRGNIFQVHVWFNKKSRHIGHFKTVRAGVIAHGYTEEALKDFRKSSLNLSEKDTIEMMEIIVKLAQEMGNRYDAELNQTIVGEGGTNTAVPPRIATRKRSPTTTTAWEGNSNGSSKRLRRGTDSCID